MKIACLGNMNNVLFSVARYLRDMGYDVDLLMSPNEGDNFHPSADTYDLEFMNYCRKLQWGTPFSYNSTSVETIRIDLSKYDFIIGEGSAPAFCYKAGIKLDLFIPYGTDVISYLEYSIVNPVYLYSYLKFIRAQRAGVRKVKDVLLNSVNYEWEKNYRNLKTKANRIYKSSPYLYATQYVDVEPDHYSSRTQWGFYFKEQRKKYDLIIFQHRRQLWCTEEEHTKGTLYEEGHYANNVFFHGIKQFLNENPNIKIGVQVLEYGPDVQRSKDLIQSLGLQNIVTWLPQMFRKDLMAGLFYSDIAVGSLSASALTYCSVCEILAMGKTFMGTREDTLYLEEYSDLYPMLNVNSPEGVAQSIEDYIKNPSFYKELGKKGKEWFDKNVTEASLNEIEKCILQSEYFTQK
jgi:hypothetical protein